MVSKLIADGELVLMSDVAAEFNVDRQAIYGWAKRHKKKVFIHNRRRYMRFKDAEIYGGSRVKGSARVPYKPKGWVLRKSIEIELDGGATFLIGLEKKGHIRCLRYKGVVYVHPEDAKYAKELYLSKLSPQPGWIILSEVAAKANRTREAVSMWCRSHKVPLKKFRHPVQRNPAWHMREEDAERYYEAARKKGTAIRRGVLRRKKNAE